MVINVWNLKCAFVNVEQNSQFCWKEDSKMLKYPNWNVEVNKNNCRIKYGERNHNRDKEYEQGNSINTTVNTQKTRKDRQARRSHVI